MVCLGNRDYSVVFEIASKYCISDSFVDQDGYFISSEGFLPTVVDIMVIWVNSPIPVHFSSLIPRMSTLLLPSPFWLVPICLDSWTWHSRFLCNIALYNIRPCFYHQSHPHLGIVFALLHPFILSGVISPLISSTMLGTYWPWEFLFQFPIILLFHTIHGILKARILKWFANPFSSGPHSVRPLHHDPPILGYPVGTA